METSICSITGTETFLSIKPQANTKLLSKFISNWQKKNTNCIIISNGSTESHKSIQNQSNMHYMFLPKGEIPQNSNFFDISNSIQKIQNFVNVSNVEAERIEDIYKYSTASLEKRVTTKEQAESYRYLQELKFPKNDSLRALNAFGFNAYDATEYLLQTNGVCFEKNVSCVQQNDDSKNNACMEIKIENLSNMADISEFAEFHSVDTRNYCIQDLVMEAERVNKLFGIDRVYFSQNIIACVTEAIYSFMQEDFEKKCYESSDVDPSTLLEVYNVLKNFVKGFLTERLNTHDMNFSLYLVTLEALHLKAMNAIEKRWEEELYRIINQFQVFVSIITSTN